MPSLLVRLSRLRPSRSADLALRLAGLGLLLACRSLALLAQARLAAPRHPVTFADFTLCAAAFALLVSGLALCLEGAGLFRLVPIPRHSAFGHGSWHQRPAGHPVRKAHNLALDSNPAKGANSGA